VLARLARVFLVIALLAGWQAALQHPIEHVDALGEFVHLHSSHSHEDGSEAGLLCDTLAALTACAPEALAFNGQLFSDYQVPSQPLGAPRVAQAPPFLSQGPPIAPV
jgi:hypothetical protein